MSLAQRLAAEIAANGPITVARFMERCLHDPVGGYYATRPSLGIAGDFVTAPLVSQMFGELIGVWCIELWRAMGAPARLVWIELGPGDATLMADVRRVMARLAPEALAAGDLVLVETSTPLRERQAAALVDATPRFAAAFTEAAGPAPIILIANEFLDCLPARQFVRTETGWAERRVGLGPAGALTFGLAAPPADFAPPRALGDAPPGSLIEISSAQIQLGAEIGAHVARWGGAALLIDYGRAHPDVGDTLQALRRHAKVDPLDHPGEADLTVHADFPAVAAAARAAGASTTPIVGQGEFLRRLGIEPRAAALTRASPDRAATIARQLTRLTAPDAMGELFKVLVIHAPDLAVPGFEATP